MGRVSPRCFRCLCVPFEDPDCVSLVEGEDDITPDVVAREDGTYNGDENTYCCTRCYIEIGQPSSPTGWKAPGLGGTREYGTPVSFTYHRLGEGEHLLTAITAGTRKALQGNHPERIRSAEGTLSQAARSALREVYPGDLISDWELTYGPTGGERIALIDRAVIILTKGKEPS